MATDIIMFLLAFVVAVSLLGSVIVIFGGLLFGGLLFGGLPQGRRAQRDQPAALPKTDQAPSFYGWHPADMPVSDELVLRQIEHHLRREALIAEQFIKNPSSETLHATEHSLRVH